MGLPFATAASAAPVFYCDIDNDGFSDLPVGSPNETRVRARDGLVTAFFGDRQGVGAGRWTTVWLTNPARLDGVGQVTLCADLNGDGFEDLVSGVPFRKVGRKRGAGLVFIVYGSTDGLDFSNSEIITQATPGVAGRPQPDDNFGRELTWGDFNADGFADLVISATGEDVRGTVDAGQVHVLYGSAQGVLDETGRARGFVVHQNKRGIRDRAERGDAFGISLIASDFDGDRLVDLAVGVPLEDINGKADAGAIHVIYGNGRGLSRRDQFLHQDLASVPGTADTRDRFGAPLFSQHFIGQTLADCLNRPCAAELVVGVPGENVAGVQDAGAVYILRGTPIGLTGRGGEVWHRGRRGVAGRPSANEQFGHALAVGFFDSDLDLDLAVGVPGDSVRGRDAAGSIHLIFGDGDGLSRRDRIITKRTPGIPGRIARNERFGTHLAVGDFNGDGWSDLAAGVPLEDVRGEPDAGAVVMILGTNLGLDGLGARRFTQDAAPSIALGGPEAGDNFGVFSAFLPGFIGLNPSSVAGLDSTTPLPLPGIAWESGGE